MNRMKLWRSKKRSQEAGRLTQVCVWAPEAEAELARMICTRIAEPAARGESLRGQMLRQLDRRRTLGPEWHGFSTHVELDYPVVGPWWLQQHIGGRILGPSRTHIELTPEEAASLRDRLQRLCQDEIEAWLKEHDLLDRLRDDTGVVIEPAWEDPHRPADDEAFAANEARVARAINQNAIASRKPPVDDPSVVQYEGFFGFPSFCQVAHRKLGDRIQFAVIHMPNGGTTPTNMIESLATYLRQKFYPDVDAGRIDWFDVRPPDPYWYKKVNINLVTMQHANGVYSDPDWEELTDVAEDWKALIEETIENGKTARNAAELTPSESTEESTPKRKSAKRR